MIYLAQISGYIVELSTYKEYAFFSSFCEHSCKNDRIIKKNLKKKLFSSKLEKFIEISFDHNDLKQSNYPKITICVLMEMKTNLNNS